MAWASRSSRLSVGLLVVAGLVGAACGIDTVGHQLASGSAAPSGADAAASFDAGPSCGNGTREADEECDDGNAHGGDGCSGLCKVEAGYRCSDAAHVCAAAACGDGIVAGVEACDDGNTTAGDGCSGTCTLEPGYACATAGKPCVPTVCGDGRIEGSEVCDDGNTRPYDGCSPTCTREPSCPDGHCASVCGDGFVTGSEQCDDGNARAGDGCSDTCTLEPGFECAATNIAPPTIALPIVYRDFQTPHPDFETFCCAQVKGMVQPLLDSAGKPVLADVGNPQMISSAASFADWYRAAPGVNMTVLDTLTLTHDAVGAYAFESSGFFPLDGRGFGDQGRAHNYHFTSELRFWFTYRGSEVLEFLGDDDVFVFVGGHLGVDLGGVHAAASDSLTLDASKAAQLGLSLGDTVEIAVFQAERHTTDSNYNLTLRDFVRTVTTCATVCGDGIRAGVEACDDGNLKAGDGCSPTCTLE